MIGALLAVALLTGAPDVVAQGATVSRPIAVLRGLDKFSGLTTTFEAVIGAPVVYDRLTITVRACRVTTDGAHEDATAWLEIIDAKTPETPVFAGWMVASSPALSALDHPRYDVWVLSCKTASGEAS